MSEDFDGGIGSPSNGHDPFNLFDAVEDDPTWSDADAEDARSEMDLFALLRSLDEKPVPPTYKDTLPPPSYVGMVEPNPFTHVNGERKPEVNWTSNRLSDGTVFDSLSDVLQVLRPGGRITAATKRHLTKRIEAVDAELRKRWGYAVRNNT